MNTNEKSLLAEKIARRVIEEMQSAEVNDSSQFQATLKDLQTKLENLEAKLETSNNNSHFSFNSSYPSHASQERFPIEEAIGEEVNQFFPTEKACAFEPNGKPCDHCAMCSSRGF